MSRVVSCKFKNVSVTFLRIIALTKSHRRNIGIDNNHFLTGILYLYIMSTGYISLYIIFIMLITTIRQICSQENNFSRRDVLIQTLKNVEKQARYEERLAFLFQCRRSRVFPKFIQSLANPTLTVFRPTVTLSKRLNTFQKELLNEAIQDTSRTLAFLNRENRRLSLTRNEQQHPLNSWTVTMALRIYEAKKAELSKHLHTKFSKLVEKVKTCQVDQSRSISQQHSSIDRQDLTLDRFEDHQSNVCLAMSHEPEPALAVDSVEGERWFDASSDPTPATAEESDEENWFDAISWSSRCHPTSSTVVSYPQTSFPDDEFQMTSSAQTRTADQGGNEEPELISSNAEKPDLWLEARVAKYVSRRPLVWPDLRLGYSQLMNSNRHHLQNRR